MSLVYALTLLHSAALLFVVQPLWARLVLPLMGGSPAVWNTAMLFFQAALLLAYGYAHVVSTRLPLRPRIALHLGVLLLAALALPLDVPADLGDQIGDPTANLLWAMARHVGLPFFAVAATSPLLQRWFAASGHRHAGDPYFLYAASNLGSMLGLFAHPLLAEPLWDLSSQTRAWQSGYGILAALTLACGLLVRRAVEPTQPKVAVAIPLARQGHWLALAAVPSALMLAVTTHLSSSVAAVPLLWVLPLGLYLLSFVLVFARRRLPQPLIERAVPLLLAPLVLTLAIGANHPVSVLIPLHLLTFLALALACHGRLAQDRPPTEALTRYYLLQSAGGVVGGLFGALLAPHLFATALEYPLLLTIAAALGLYRQGDWRGLRPGWALLPGLVAAGILLGLRFGGHAYGGAATAVFATAALGTYGLSRQGGLFGLAVGGVLAAATLAEHPLEGHLEHATRSFFGVHRVTADGQGFRNLFHGVTLHGRQRRDQACEPLLYYHRTGPIGQLLTERGFAADASVGVVGLGTGCLACYAQPGQTWTFFEIDPSVHDLARQRFGFLRQAVGQVMVILGDARQTVRNVPMASLDLLVLDAYSSDSIPMHLLTREAMALYRSRLKPGGLVALHVSNRYFDLAPVVGQLAQEAGWLARVRDDAIVPDDLQRQGKTESRWMVLAGQARDLGPLATDVRWQPPAPRQGPAWTDERGSALEALTW